MGWNLPWTKRREQPHDPADLTRLRLVMTGKVQAVGFRFTATSVAEGRPVTGWVKNLDNGDVMVEVQGTPRSVNDYERALLDECASDRTWIEATVTSRDNVPVITGEKSFRVAY